MLLRRPGSSRIRSNNQTGPVPRPEGLAFRQITRPRLTFREQLVGRFVQTLLLTARIRQMTNQVAIQLVNVRTLKIVKLLTFEAEDRVTRNHADMDAFAVEYIAVHDRPPIEVPHAKGCACWAAIARQIALGLFPLRLLGRLLAPRPSRGSAGSYPSWPVSPQGELAVGSAWQSIKRPPHYERRSVPGARTTLVVWNENRRR